MKNPVKICTKRIKIPMEIQISFVYTDKYRQDL